MCLTYYYRYQYSLVENNIVKKFNKNNSSEMEKKKGAKKGKNTLCKLVGVFRVTYPLNADNSKAISVYMDAEAAFLPKISIHQSGLKHINISQNDWVALLSSNSFLNDHFTFGSGCENSVFELTETIRIRYAWRNKQPIILMEEVDTIQSPHDNSIVITRRIWERLTLLSHVIDNALQDRSFWKECAMHIVHDIRHKYQQSVANKSNTNGSFSTHFNLSPNLSKYKSTNVWKSVPIHVHELKKVMDDYELTSAVLPPSNFDLQLFLHEMLMFYPREFGIIQSYITF